jgi:hypothetical protein
MVHDIRFDGRLGTRRRTDMPQISIYKYSNALSWSSGRANTSTTQNASTKVSTANVSGAVYWWAGTGNINNDSTLLESGEDFIQGTIQLQWSFATNNSNGTPPQVTLTITGTNDPP